MHNIEKEGCAKLSKENSGLQEEFDMELGHK